MVYIGCSKGKDTTASCSCFAGCGCGKWTRPRAAPTSELNRMERMELCLTPTGAVSLSAIYGISSPTLMGDMTFSYPAPPENYRQNGFSSLR